VATPNADYRARLQAWFAGQLPDGWFEGPPEVTFDNDEILVVGTLPPPGNATETAEAEAEAIDRFREETRDQRMLIAEEGQSRLGRKVSWGVRCGSSSRFFTTATMPVMTRLRMPERLVLDTLIDAGVARSRSEALAWCVRLVGRNEAGWIDDLRAAFHHVESVRAQGPRSTRGAGGHE
jgi:hypothetical protein